MQLIQMRAKKWHMWIVMSMALEMVSLAYKGEQNLGEWSSSEKFTLEKPITVVSGQNTINLLSLTIGLQAGSVGSESSLETAWRAESESLKSILTGAPQSRLGRLALVETLAHQILKRMKVKLPSLLSG